MTLGNKDKSTGKKDCCELQKELMSLITESDLEDLWKHQNPNGRLCTHLHGRTNTYFHIDRPNTSTNLRVRVKIDHEINTFSNNFQTILIIENQQTLKGGKATGY